jgi:hypothetical protein
MDKNSLIGIAIVGIIIVISLLIGGQNNFIFEEETNQTILPDSVQEVHSDQVMGKLSHTISLNNSLPNKIDNVIVYKDIPLYLTRQDIISLGQKFNISSPYKIKEGEKGFSIGSEDRSADALIMNTGWVEYTNNIRAHNENSLDIPGNLPSDDEAVKIATKFLKDRDLFPKGAELLTVDHGKIYGQDENGNDTVVWEDIQVWYGRKLNGITVEGTQLMLAIGANGEPLEFFTNWRTYEPFKKLPVKTPESAFKELKTKGVYVGSDKPDKVVINTVYLAYYTKAGAFSEEYLEPVWVFQGDVVVDDKSIKYVKEFIPALTDESVKSLALY